MKHGLALLQAGGNLSLDSTSSVHGIIPRMRQNVQHGLQQLKSETGTEMELLCFFISFLAQIAIPRTKN
jgi:hypothetical protein